MSYNGTSKKGYVLAATGGAIGGVVAGWVAVALLTKALPKIASQMKEMMTHMRETGRGTEKAGFGEAPANTTIDGEIPDTNGVGAEERGVAG